jgi:DNA-binding MarR family transcriptional regulator
MDLQRFLPYRLSVVTELVSRALAAVYAERFDLTRDEWRVIAQLADVREIKATELGARTSLPKMAVSRAVTRLERDGLITRGPDPQDKRNLVVRLLPPGRALYRRIEPMALARETFLLEGLNDAERSALEGALAKMEARARQLLQQG